MEMAMAVQTKAAAKATTTATTAFQATATGNGNSYTRNISTIKKHTEVEKIDHFTQSFSAAKLAAIFINKTKIKSKRNHLKLLINLYFKLILCISQINKTILMIFKIKTNTNSNYTHNYTSKCIINLKHKLQVKALRFKMFKLKIIIEFLTRFHYCKRKNPINYTKLTIRDFVGICLKRLISLNGLQQIPEKHNKLDKSLRSINNRIKTGNCGQLKENKQDLQLRRKIMKKEKLLQSLKALIKLRQRVMLGKPNRNFLYGASWQSLKAFLKLREIIMLAKAASSQSLKALLKPTAKKLQKLYHNKYFPVDTKESCKEKLYKIGQISLLEISFTDFCFKSYARFKEEQILNKELIEIIRNVNEGTVRAANTKNTYFKLQQLLSEYLEKYFQLNRYNFQQEIIIANSFRISSNITLQFQSETSFNHSKLAAALLQSCKKCCQVFVNIKQLNVGCIIKLHLYKELNDNFAKLKQFYKKKFNSANSETNLNFILLEFITANAQKGEKLNKFIIILIYSEFKAAFEQQQGQVGKFKACERQELLNFSSPRNYGQLQKFIDICKYKQGVANCLRLKLHKIVDENQSLVDKLKLYYDCEISLSLATNCEQTRKQRMLAIKDTGKTNLKKVQFKEISGAITKSRYDHQNRGEICLNSRQICGQQNKRNCLLFINNIILEIVTYNIKFHWVNRARKYQKSLATSRVNCGYISRHSVALTYKLQKLLIIDKEWKASLQGTYKLLIVQSNQKCINNFQSLQKAKKFNHNNIKLPITMMHKNNKNFNLTLHKQQKLHKNFPIKYTLRRLTSLSFIKEGRHDITLPYNKTNIAKQFHLDDSNNFYQVESKQQKFLKQCASILCSILIQCFCFCYWHIYGFPLVLEKNFKYLKDATVNVLTRRLKTTTTITTTTKTSIYFNCYDSIKAACDVKLADYKANNQRNILKSSPQHTVHHTSLSCCSTTSLTTSSAHTSSSTSSSSKSLKNLILQQKPPAYQKTCFPYCCCQQYQHHHQHIRQKQKTLQHQQQQQQQHQQQQHYKAFSTIHLQLPSLLVFSRTLIILILLSSLWHTSEGFHSSGVKLSTSTVRTKYGPVRGIVVRSSPSLVEAYLGIPYASPPVGSLRFMPPITPSTWKNIRDANRFSPVCPQNVPIPPNGPEALLEVPRARLAQLRRLLPLLSNQSEDCLYLNIYVPVANRRHKRFTTSSTELNDSPKLATILFIHGESYEWNSGNPYDGSELAAHGNVIVVTINFRLGILGFLKTGGKESAQGNFGLMDLVAGLHWLKENLPAFGGDPQQITLLGHGTGAALANILVVSPVASDLIQHTVMVSGSAISPWAIQKNPLFVKRRVAEQTGCHGDMLYYDLAPCLRTKSVTELLAVKIDHPRFLAGFAPFVDGTVISPNTDSIGKLSLPLGSAIVSTSGIEYANFPKRNLIFCLTSVESHLDLSAQDLEFGFNETRRERILRTYVRNNFHYHLNEIFAVLKNEYTDWDKAIRSPLSSRDATLQFLSDGHTASSLIKLAYMHSLKGGKGYFLHFKHRTIEEEYPQRTGSVRGEDVPFWLGLPISPLFPHNYTTQEKQISRLMLRYLANFAKTGNPNQSTLSSPLPSLSSLIGSPPLSTSLSSPSSSSQAVADSSRSKIKRSSFHIVNDTSSTSSGPMKNIIEDVATATAREALNLAVLYNQRRTKRTYYKRHSRSNDEQSGSGSDEVNSFLGTNNNNNNKLDSDELPFWDAYDVVNQLYMELGNKAEIQSHYRGHKLSMWLNLIPQLHRHANMNDQSMRHHQFQDDLNNLNLYEGIVRAQIQTKPDDDDETLLLPKGRPTLPPPAPETNVTQKPQGSTTECGVDGAMYVAEMTTLSPTDNRSLLLDSREKEMATASTGLIGNLEVLRRLSGKQFQSYTTALVATVAVGCFLLILNILIFAGIYHQREKRARDAKTKEELQDNDTSKNSSMLKLNALGSESGSFNDSAAGVSGKTTVVFGEYSCYDEKSLQTKDEKLIVELPPATQLVDANWAGCSTSTLDLLKTKHHTPLDTSYALGNIVSINTDRTQTEHLMAINNLEMATYNPLPLASGLIIDPSFATTSSGLLSKRGSFVGSTGQLNQYDFASVQSSDQMSFKDIENAVKASAARSDDITPDDDIPEPPPPPRSFKSMQQQQQQKQQQQQQAAANTQTAASGSGGGGILRQTGSTSATQTGGGKKRVHIQEISV